ncbi:MAG: hypothetical protein Q4G67_12255 [Actinomycetia bacterium]|nr:hypothetical protein [Actinomycetes bacterium]
MRPTGEVVTVLRTTGGGVDWDGYPLPETVERVPVPGSVVEDGGGELTVQLDGKVVVKNMRVLFPGHVDVGRGDTLEVRGETFRVDTDPFTHASQWGRADVGGTVVEIVRATA